MNLLTKRNLSLFFWIVLLLLIGSLQGSSNQNNVDNWYILLKRSALTPPNYIFPIAWSILYIMIAVSGWLLWGSKSFARINLVKILFIVQLLLNWSWTWLFFGFHQSGIALICLSLITILVGLIISQTYKKLNIVALLLLPYLLWLLFATYLNYYIWQHN